MRQNVYLTVHGPIFPQGKGIKGETIALPSTDSEVVPELRKFSAA